MSLKLKRNLIIFLTAFVLLFASLAIFVAPNKFVKVNAEIIEAQLEDIEDNYILNAKETFPVSITTPVVATDGVVIYPNGKVYQIADEENQPKEFKLDVAGNYTLRYFAAEHQIVEKTFLVSQKHFVLSVEEEAGKNDIVAATKESMQGIELPNGENYDYVSRWPSIEQNRTTFFNRTEGSKSAIEQEGLIVRLENGTKFTYAVPIDLTQAGANGLTDIIKFQPFHGTMYTPEDETWDKPIELIAEQCVITLTDCYDSSRYLRFIVDDRSNTPYSRAGTDNLIDAGWIFPAEPRDFSGTNAREFYEGTQYGYAYIASYGIRPAGQNYERPDRDGIFFKYDYNNAKVWATSEYWTGGDYKETMVTDFMNKSVYSGADYRGFTTGEVYLSIEFLNYQSAGSARVDIYEIAGQKASDLIAMKQADDAGETATLFSDTKNPVIDVDFTPTLSDGVYVDVGTNFTVPSAVAYDVNLKGDLNVRAYQYYGTNNRADVPIINNKILISQEETYYIVYSAEDSYGNKIEEVIKVFGIKDENNPAISFDCGGELSNLKAGMTNVLPKFIFNTRNNEADRKVKITISSDKESFVIADLKNGQEIDEFLSKDAEFILSYSGEYTIEYAYSDNALSGVFSYKVSTSASDVITFPDKPMLPRYLIKDAIYDFDEIYAYNYANGSQQPHEKAEIYIAYDEYVDQANVANSVFTKLDSAYSNTITGSEKAVLKYVYESTVTYTSVAKIVDTNIGTPKSLEQYKYFVGNFATAHKDDPTYDEELFAMEIYNEDNGEEYFERTILDYKSKVFTGNNTLEFINIIDLSDFSFGYRIINDSDSRIDADNFNALRLVFTDPYNEENKAYARIYKENDAVYLDLNGEVTQKVNQEFAASADKSFSYDLSTQKVSLSGVNVKIPFAFNFTTNKAYFDIVFEDIVGVAGIRILELNGHKFNHHGAARSTYPIALMDIPQGNYKIGDIITINPAEFIDVLSPVVKVNISLAVNDPNGNPVVALDNTVLNGSCDPYKSYQIRVETLGEYTISYVATSGIKMKSTPPGYVLVCDLNPPEITLKGGLSENCVVYLKPGQKYNVQYSVKDDGSLKENLFTRIVWTNRYLAASGLFDSNTIYFIKEGTYEVGISSVDEMGNFARKTFTVIVTNEEVK